jgi:hypothetical protein
MVNQGSGKNFVTRDNNSNFNWPGHPVYNDNCALYEGGNRKLEDTCMKEAASGTTIAA